MITRHIADLLYHHECVIVPGLGGFLKAYSPAMIHHLTHEFRPPSGNVAFNAGLSGNDGQLANHIVSVEKATYHDALFEIKSWVDECYKSLKNGDKVVVEGIGVLFMNSSRKIEFIPSADINFNADSYGLPVFFAKTAGKESFILPEIQPTKHTHSHSKYSRLVPETLKWAAVLGPFVAFVLWGSLNGNIINNYVHNYTGMYSWVRSTPGKTVPVKAIISNTTVKENTVPGVVQSPAGILTEQNISFDPGMISYAELAQHNIAIKDPSVVAAVEPNTCEQDYFIIGGAFRDQNNALKLISTLQQQGYPAAVVDTTPSGLYVVSMKGFTDYYEAVNQLSEIKKAGFESSWILKKRRG
jgi:hypothetical protein